MKIVFLSLIIIIYFFVLIPSQIPALATIQTQSSAGNSYNAQKSNTIPIQTKTTKKQSLLSKIGSIVTAAVVGSTGVVIGAFYAWYTLHKKRKTFNTYYEQINQAQQQYREALTLQQVNKEEARIHFEKALMHIQEHAELNSAQKKLDQEQLTAIINKINRIMDENI